MKSKNVDMLNGSIYKGLLSLAIPIMIMNVMQTLFNTIDMSVLKVYSNDAAVGAVGVCGNLIVLCTTLLTGISTGINVVVAKCIGLGNYERAKKAVKTAIVSAIIGGILLMLVCVIFGETFLKIINCPDKLLPKAVSYFKIYFYGVPALLLYSYCAAILRAIGDVKRPMCFLVFGGVLKVLLTFLLVSNFNVDVEAVAIATTVSNIITCVLALITLLKYQNVIELSLAKTKFSFSELKSMLYIGIPAGLQSAMYAIANVVIVAAVNSLGADATTGMSIANQFDGILYQIALAPSFAVMPYVAQNVGAGNIKRVKKAFICAIVITTAFGGVLGGLSAIFSEELSYLLSETRAVIEFSKQKMIIVSSTYFICGINEVLSGTLRGLGKPIQPTISAFVYFCLLRLIWVYALFPHLPNLTFLYSVWPIGWTLSIITLLIPYLTQISKMQKNSV